MSLYHPYVHSDFRRYFFYDGIEWRQTTKDHYTWLLSNGATKANSNLSKIESTKGINEKIMTEFYVKYQHPKPLFEFEPGYDIPYEEIDKGELVDIFLTDSKGRVMVFQSETQAKAQIQVKKAKDWKFKRWAKNIKIIKGSQV